MGCGASVQDGPASGAVGKSTGIVSEGTNRSGVKRTVTLRRLTMKHTPKIDNEPAQRLHMLILELGPTGKMELTSVTAHAASGQESGTLVKNHIPCLKQIPGMILNMTQLTELNLRCNQIYVIPKEIEALRSLEVLVVAENQLFELPKELTRLSNLKLLDLSENHISALPDSMGELQNLEILRMNRNKLTALPDGLGGCQRLKIINFYNNQIESLGSGIAELTEIEELNLSNNAIFDFPTNIDKWRNMKQLYIQVNRLSKLPSLDALQSLELLQAHQNALKCFPEMGKLAHLKKIDVNNNQIREITPSFENLTALVHLNIRRNCLTSIPAFLCRCKSLEILDLGFNPLVPPVPADLVALPHLKTFLLDGTKITTLPIELIALRQVSRVNVGNCLRMDDQETCEVVTELREICAQNGGWLKTG
ncbi:TPA: hypothetical protein N0F65_010785 [Lagenidium giganteum]|uniref:Disease resistance R13L4/SHOC-2-like LRR domain-containing protein n=1 Tax=Lagenidium giganteum TaxID=4803 RepID=A0AAV2YSV0_9STRA|nr:TPA: hypothetical protein N0F65_010785 [Lagenidium giganteum]